MKRNICFLFIILIIIFLSSFMFVKSTNSNNFKNTIFLNEEEQKYSECEQENITEIAEVPKDKIEKNKEQLDYIEVINTNVSHEQESPKEEKVISSPQKENNEKDNIQKTITKDTIQETKNENETQKVIPQTEQNQKNENLNKSETKQEQIKKCNNTSHGVGTGNANKWFDSELEAINYYKSIIKLWGDKWEKFEIDDETYNKNCPYGYEDWSCPYCGKWTINFYYN